MSFKKIVFNYIPPPTIPSQLGIGPGVSNPPSVITPTLSGTLGAAYQNSRAGQLVQRLQDLKATETYLQSCVVSLCQGLGVSVSPTSDPDLTRSLSRIYNTPDQVPAISLDMYRNLLQAEMDIMRVDMGLDPTSGLQVSPVQRLDINLATSNFEKTIAADGGYKTSLPLFLPILSGDGIIFGNMTAQLQDYPVLRNNDPNGVDVSQPIADMLNDVADRQTAVYGTMYNTMAGPGPFGLSIPPAVVNLAGNTLNQLGSILGMLGSLVAIFHKPAQAALAVSLNVTILPRLISDMTGHLFNLDKFIQMAVNPVALLNTGIGAVMGQIPQPYGSILGAGLTPLFLQAEMSAQQQALQQQLRSKTPPLPPISSLPSSLLTMGAALKFSSEQTQLHATDVKTNTSKAMDRRLNESGNQVEVTSSLQSVETMTGVIQALMSTKSSGAQVATPTGSPSNLSVVGQVIGNLKVNTGTSYTVQGSSLVLTPSTLPQPSTQVSTVLKSGGATIVGPNSLITVPIGA